MSAGATAPIQARLRALGCDPAQVEESFVHAAGAGGQNVNKVATCVVLRSAALRIQIKMQEHRTQGANRTAAWRLLVEQLETRKVRLAAERQAAREKARRQKVKRPRGVKKQFVELKRRRSQTKSARRATTDE